MRTFQLLPTERDRENMALVMKLEAWRRNGIDVSASDALRAALAAYVAQADTRAVEQAKREIKKQAGRLPEAA